jgi:hypothetical protein
MKESYIKGKIYRWKEVNKIQCMKGKENQRKPQKEPGPKKGEIREIHSRCILSKDASYLPSARSLTEFFSLLLPGPDVTVTEN